MNFDQKIKPSSTCACKGIRNCILCAPDLVEKELTNEIDRLKQSIELNYNTIYIYCIKCNQSVRLDINLINQIEQFLNPFYQFEQFTCICESLSDDYKIKINGIYVLNNALNKDEESFLINEINKTKWIDSQSGLPNYSKLLIDRLLTLEKNQISNFIPVELCNLKYDPDRAACIDPHYDDFWLWGDRLITFNLMSNTFLTLTPGQESIEKNCEILIPLQRFSVIVLRNEARYKWLHSIKKAHIKTTRLAITLRELSEEYKKNDEQGKIGKLIEKLSLTFRGVSIGLIEDFFKNDEINIDEYSNQIYPVKNDFIDLIKNDHISFDFLNIKIKPIDNENNIIKYELSGLNSNILFNIGKSIAKWRKLIEKFENKNLNESKLSDRTKTIENFLLIKNEFETYLIILKHFLNKSKIDLSIKSKMVAVVYQINELITDQIGLVLNDFRLEQFSLDYKFNTSFQNLKFSFYINDLAILITSLYSHSNIEYDPQNLIDSILNGYKSEINIQNDSNEFKLLNCLIILNLILKLDKDKNDNFKLTSFIEKLYFEN